MAQFEGLTPGTWPLDASHTSAGFTIRHAGISRVRGQFVELSGSLTVDENAEDLRFEANLQTASITTSNEDRDNHLRSADFFDAESHPSLTDRKSTRLNSSHVAISYAVFCLKKKRTSACARPLGGWQKP